jgi:flagellar P-ring protein FlgI
MDGGRMNRMRGKLSMILAVVSVVLAAGPAHGVKIADITRLDGQRTNVLMGLGLVVGLKGTGDGGDFAPAINPLRKMLANFADPVTVRELNNVQNVALVMVTATVPNGVRDGDRLDVHVMSIGAAQSLKGGWLLIAPLMGPRPDAGIFALAEGPVSLEDASTPTTGIVKGGAVMEADLPAPVIDEGRITLVIEQPSASWTMASTIAKIINDAEGTGETLAIAVNAKNVVVTIPENERRDPASFISRVQQLPVRILDTEARVVINEKKKTIIITGDVEISPVVISSNGLTISTVAPAPVPTPRNPVTTEKTVVAVDTTKQGGAKLQELMEALEAIRVPAEDRIAIIRELHKSGKLHAKLEEK